MTKRELASHLEQEISSALGYKDGKLSDQRSDAMDRYYGKKYGNEQEGRSQVVSNDVLDTVESLMPSLMRIFTAGDNVFSCEGMGPEDEEMARQCSDYLNYIFFVKIINIIIAIFVADVVTNFILTVLIHTSLKVGDCCDNL